MFSRPIISYLLQVKSIAECTGELYSGPALKYHLSLRPLFYLILSGRLRQVLLYVIMVIYLSHTHDVTL